MKNKITIEANPCKYREINNDKDFCYCCKDLVNNTGDIEPCYYCNTDLDSAYMECKNDE